MYFHKLNDSINLFCTTVLNAIYTIQTFQNIDDSYPYCKNNPCTLHLVSLLISISIYG